MIHTFTMQEPDFQLWNHFEEPFCQSGALPRGDSSNEEIFRSMARKNNARSSQALAIQGKVDPLLALRSSVYRGQLESAQKLAQELLDRADSSLKAAEVLLEQARIHAMNADWIECLAVCDIALGLEQIAPVSQLTLFQIRALSSFELGRFNEAISDLDTIEALASVFPESPGAFYASLIRVRILARDRGAELAERECSILWKRLLASPGCCLDRIHALIRTDLDLQRLKGSVSPAHLLASYRIPQMTGEKLYSALAALEAAYSGIPELSRYFAPIVENAAKEFQKVRSILAELRGEKELGSVTGATLAAASGHHAGRARSPKVEFLLESLPTAKSLLVPSHEIVIQLEPFSLVSLEGFPQLNKAILALSEGRLEMNEFFSRVWGRQKYSEELHATLISSLLYRLRKKTGVLVGVSLGKAQIKDAWVLA